MLTSHTGLLALAFAIVSVGFLFNYFGNPALKQAAPALESCRLLGFIPLGSGLPGLYLMTVVALALTVVCFWDASFLMLFPGLNIAIELGGVTAIWLRLLQTGHQPD